MTQLEDLIFNLSGPQFVAIVIAAYVFTECLIAILKVIPSFISELVNIKQKK